MSVNNDVRTSDFVSRISLEIPSDGITFKDFLELIGEQGFLMSCIILVAPFLLPVSIPGSSLPFGLAIILINMGILFNKHPLLPKRVMEYNVSQDNMLRILNGMVRVLTTLEKFTKPRSMFLFNTQVMEYVNSLIIIFCAFLLMLPLPVPLTDFLPAYGILFLAVGSLERDGYLIFAGYLLVIITTIYFSLIAILGLSGMKIILAHLGLHY